MGQASRLAAIAACVAASSATAAAAVPGVSASAVSASQSGGANAVAIAQSNALVVTERDARGLAHQGNAAYVVQRGSSNAAATSQANAVAVQDGSGLRVVQTNTGSTRQSEGRGVGTSAGVAHGHSFAGGTSASTPRGTIVVSFQQNIALALQVG